MSLFDMLNPSQKEAVCHTDGSLIIFAGAGTGKTRVITCRIAYLLEKSVSPYSILGVTFTNKAANEMKKRVTDLVPGAGENVWISTFHSFCARFLRIEAKNIGLNPDFVIYDYADQKSLIKDCISELLIDDKKFKPALFLDKISRAKDDLITPQNYTDTNSNVITDVYKLYQNKMETVNALDFGDLIMRTVFSLKQYPEICQKYQERFKYILIDEYQDTNHAQYMLAKILAAKYKNICVVGDDDQSVYSWRGADISNILEFEKDYPQTKIIKLEQNYRSTPKILSSAWNVVKNNSQRVEKKLWTKNSDEGIVCVIKTLNENDEAAQVANLIFLNSQTGKYSFSDFAVFYRTNAQSRVFEDAFRRDGIPYCVVGTLKFYDRAEIKNIMSYLKLIHNPNDNISLKRIINIPKRGIGKTTMENLEAEALKRNISIWQTIPFMAELEISRNTQAQINSFAQMINELIRLKDSQDVKTIAEKVINLCGYVKELELENTAESKTKIENIQELISAIEDFERRSPDKTLAGYLTQTALISDADSGDDSNGKTTLMTLHLAKGLEFDNVFICGLEEQLFPVGESVFNRDELEEERRLMYVGMTRARKNLYLCWAMERMIFGKRKWNIISRFISEAGFKDEFSDNIGKHKFTFVGNYKHYTPKNKDNDFVDFIPSDDDIIIDAPPEDLSPYKIGALVSHSLFGKGKIIEKNGTGNDLKLVVLFENGQWKKLLAKAANLKLI
jgi:DNA helicase-2/ATP-dependent DNA helicase PcrA